MSEHIIVSTFYTKTSLARELCKAERQVNSFLEENEILLLVLAWLQTHLRVTRVTC